MQRQPLDEARNQLLEAVAAVKDKMEAVVSSMTEGLKAAEQGLTDNTAKLTETTASYRDTPESIGPHGSMGRATPIRTPSMAPRLQAREGVRARQVLIDIDDCTEPEAEALSISLYHGPQEEIRQGPGQLWKTMAL